MIFNDSRAQKTDFASSNLIALDSHHNADLYEREKEMSFKKVHIYILYNEISL
jgi:hypothetical protein